MSELSVSCRRVLKWMCVVWLSDGVDRLLQFWIKIEKMCNTSRALSRVRVPRLNTVFGRPIFSYFEAPMVTGWFRSINSLYPLLHRCIISVNENLKCRYLKISKTAKLPWVFAMRVSIYMLRMFNDPVVKGRWSRVTTLDPVAGVTYRRVSLFQLSVCLSVCPLSSCAGVVFYVVVRSASSPPPSHVANTPTYL